ncbi:hypothetical protein DL766_002483 [Monosporascus sp. MC13-8B]|uniref:ATP synthase subunit d, mitochondrial n=1 Tax=Monosporascus cannonballus TaxID=155416 RepID=A0ABY0HC94_9PEZI|nr:hypothetical protein DL762_002844 [Monosporascus cannonballus]RYO95581.1 hypothetical protein DL763_003651 [Monosporascus cannonballus]RYP35472.1 hypothetical protein DL766_002483 [Monosporascus sp. MC13-8B]
MAAVGQPPHEELLRDAPSIPYRKPSLLETLIPQLTPAFPLPKTSELISFPAEQPRSAALKLDWAKVTTSLGLRGQTAASLQAFKQRNENARRRVAALQEQATTVDFAHYRSVLKNRAVVDEVERRFKEFKPATYDVQRQLKAIDAFEVEAVRNAEQTKEKVDLELQDLQKTLRNIEEARPFDELTVEEVAAAEPSIDEKTAKLVSKGRWTVPGYKVRLPPSFFMAAAVDHVRVADKSSRLGKIRRPLPAIDDPPPPPPPAHTIPFSLCTLELPRNPNVAKEKSTRCRSRPPAIAKRPPFGARAPRHRGGAAELSASFGPPDSAGDGKSTALLRCTPKPAILPDRARGPPFPGWLPGAQAPGCPPASPNPSDEGTHVDVPRPATTVTPGFERPTLLREALGCLSLRVKHPEDADAAEPLRRRSGAQLYTVAGEIVPETPKISGALTYWNADFGKRRARSQAVTGAVAPINQNHYSGA